LLAGTLLSCVVLWAPTLASAGVEIAASHLSPRFDPDIHSYTTSCTAPTRIHARAPGATMVRIGARDWSRRSAHRTVKLKPGQAIEVSTRRGGRETYVIRCLPKSFPEFEFRRGSKPRHSLYVMSNTRAKTLADIPDRNYAFVIDSHGTPVWWMQASPQAIDTKVLSDGTIAWATWYGGTYGTDPRTRYEIRTLDGRLVRKLKTVGTATDHHELQEGPNGNYIITSYRPRLGVDALLFNGDVDATVLDAVVQEVTPRGELVYEWSSEDHIALDETGRWWTYTAGTEPYDNLHINAVEPLQGGDFLISLHNTDAVYRIDRETGEVEWKLGGTTTPESLSIAGDSQSYTLAGQHDVRDLGNGEISVFDNGTLTANPARVVRFRVEGTTATLIDQVSDPRVPYSNCCGSAAYDRKDDSWLISWGGTRFVTEVNRRDRRTFTLEFSRDHIFSYRVRPVDDQVSTRELRAGMSERIPNAR
jgi:hypothetical protein